MRTFHIGGAASRAAAVNSVEIKGKGTVRWHNLKAVHHEKGHWVAVSRSGELGVIDEFGRERERYRIPYGAVIIVRARAMQGRAGPDRRELGSAHPPGGHRGGGLLIRSRTSSTASRCRARWTRSPASRAPWCMDPKQRGAGGKDLRPVIKLRECQGQGSLLREHGHSGGLRAAGRRAREPRGRRQGVGRRRHRPHPAGVLEDPRHHGRSAARGGPVRGPQAQGFGDPRRVLGHRQLRQGDQGQAPPDHHRRARREARGADSEVAPPQRVRGRARRARRRSSRTASRTRTTSCACRASSRWRTTSCARSRTSTDCRA